MASVKQFEEEYKKYGSSYVWHHFVSRMFKSKTSSEKMAEIHRKYCENLTAKELIEENMALYSKCIGHTFDFYNPKTFTEKIQHIKILDSTAEKSFLTDKLTVKHWVADKVGEQYVIPTVGGGWDNFDDIDFTALPDKFVLKMNNGSGMNYPVIDKSQLNVREAKKLFDKWVKTEFCWYAFEMQYRRISNKIFAEKFVEEMDGNLYDYKIHCFDGKPRFIQLIGDRNLLKHTGAQRFFDTDWNQLDWDIHYYPDFTHDVARPANLNEMLAVATKLSEGFNYVRVDLYDINGQVYFGEMTFTPGAGLYPYKGKWTYEVDEKLGGCCIYDCYTSPASPYKVVA